MECVAAQVVKQSEVLVVEVSSKLSRLGEPFVTALSRDELKDISEMRIELDRLAAPSAVLSGSETETFAPRTACSSR